MARYVLLRLSHALVILVIVTVLVFVIAHLLPGDAVMAAMSGSVDMQDSAVVARVRHQFGLDQPLYSQFLAWLSHFLRGDWGTSIGTGEPVLDMWATVWSFTIGSPVGIVSAIRRGSALDAALTTIALLGVSIPPFWLAIVLIYLLAVALPIFPPSGYAPSLIGT